MPRRQWYYTGVRTDFLFAVPSWLSGAARTLDMGGQFDEYNESPNEAAADAKALFADWWAVGDSLVNAMKAFRLESQKQEPQTE